MFAANFYFSQFFFVHEIKCIKLQVNLIGSHIFEKSCSLLLNFWPSIDTVLLTGRHTIPVFFYHNIFGKSIKTNMLACGPEFSRCCHDDIIFQNQFSDSSN